MKRRLHRGARGVREQQAAGRNMFALMPVVILAVVLVASVRPTAPASLSNPWAESPSIRYDLLDETPEPLPGHTSLREVRPGDTIEMILVEAGYSRSEALELVREFSSAIDPTRLRIGEIFRFRYGPESSVNQVALRIRGWGEITGVRSGERFDVRTAPAEPRSEEILISGRIDSTLYGALLAQGESPLLIDRMNDVFQWDIDFFRLRRGDQFRAIVEKRFRGDDFVGYGPVTAARFEHDGLVYEAFLHNAEDGTSGYYTREGRPVKKQFLKAPLKFPRITSGYTHRRFHPVLKKYRPHLAIDYGAPTGTPIMSTADGVVEFAGRGGGEGNYVRIRHTRNLETWYLHLSRFAPEIRKGVRVEQGQVIGYVGATGLATAPHLDYRVRQKGQWINPLELRSITPDPLEKRQLEEFLTRVGGLVARLDEVASPDQQESGTLLASTRVP
jgi:murein DD-endopeptidase MepM/ murein hydrolase activator NlpD